MTKDAPLSDDKTVVSLEGLKERLKQSEARCTHLQEQHEKLLDDARTNARLDAMQIRFLQAELEKIQDSVRYRLGVSLTMAAKSPRRLLSLPKTLWQYYRESQTGFEKTSKVAVRIPVFELRELYDVDGAEGVIEGVENEFQNRPPEDAANALVEAARILATFGFRDAEMPMLKRASELSQDEATLRALFWAAQRGGDFRLALSCMQRLEDIYGPRLQPKHEKVLEKLRRQPAFELTVFDQVESPKAPVIPLQKDRVVYVLHNSQPWSSGGYATRASGLGQGMLNAGMDVVVLSRPGFPLDLKPELRKSDVPLMDHLDGIAHHRILSPMRTELLLREYLLASADAITAELRNLCPSVVMAASNHVTALPALIAARRLGIPFIYEVRGFWEITRISREPEFETSPRFHLQKAFEGLVASAANHVMTLTGPMKDELIKRGVQDDKITLVPNSCDPARFTPRARDQNLAAKYNIPKDVPVIGYIGTFVQYEGLEHLVAACSKLRKNGHVFRVLLIGNENASGADKGPITAEIERIAAESDLTDWLIMPGRVDHTTVEAHYSLIDIAPFPRKPQPVTEMVSPMKPLEALAMQKAVVVSSVGALKEMIAHEKTGLIFEKGNIESLVSTLETLILSPELRTRLGENGRAWVCAERTWDEVGRRAASALQSVSQASSDAEVNLKVV